MDRTATIVIVIIVVIMFGIFIFVLVWGWQTTMTETTSATTGLTPPVGAGYRCKTYLCSEGTACDSVSQTCKYILGQPCTMAADCLNGSYCSGVCVIDPPGITTLTADSPCPCGPTMQCVDLQDGSHRSVCKLLTGAPCVTGDECLSSLCDLGKCTAGRAAGQPCKQTSECVTGTYCSVGYCQPIGIATGQSGSSCASGSSPGCDTGLSCVNGMCIPVSQGLGEVCDTEVFTCISPLVCLDSSNLSQCTTLSTDCNCNYPYSNESGIPRPDPNTCTTTIDCTTGFTCSSGRCVGITGNACTFTPECSTSCLSGQGGIYAVLFTTLNSSTGQGAIGSSAQSMLYNYDVRTVKISTGFTPSNITALIGYSPSSTNPVSSTTLSEAVGEAAKATIFYLTPGMPGDASVGGLIDSTGKTRIPGYSKVTTVNGDVTTITERTLRWVIMESATVGYVAFREIVSSQTVTAGVITSTTFKSNDTLYLYNSTLNTFVAYNVTTNSTNSADIPGTQYINTGTDITPLTISRVSVNYLDDFLIQSDSGDCYVKVKSSQYYTPLIQSSNGISAIGPVSQPSFYYDSTTPGVVLTLPCYADCPAYVNVSYVSGYTNVNGYRGRLVQFNGSMSGFVMPLVSDVDVYDVSDYTVYSDPVTGVNAGYMAAVATNTSNGRTGLFVSPYGLVESIPTYVNASSRLLSLGTGLYIYAYGTCS